jgi:hypothetical protein
VSAGACTRLGAGLPNRQALPSSVFIELAFPGKPPELLSNEMVDFTSAPDRNVVTSSKPQPAWLDPPLLESESSAKPEKQTPSRGRR